MIYVIKSYCNKNFVFSYIFFRGCYKQGKVLRASCLLQEYYIFLRV